MSDPSEPYTPIPCGQYSEYELAIMHQRTVRLAWRSRDGASHLSTARPLDLQTRAGEEFLIAETCDGRPLRLRLDHIVRCDVLD